MEDGQLAAPRRAEYLTHRQVALDDVERPGELLLTQARPAGAGREPE
ncbi:hypothetical protein O7599_01330 [Streptomyces sp. WMMC500]|nr:hypothetical protein [Streptomyces sp. WMMC500]WBB61232.1 hypothetical protein O7599_01330 [Streptomyces sp. WMMC500]